MAYPEYPQLAMLDQDTLNALGIDSSPFEYQGQRYDIEDQGDQRVADTDSDKEEKVD